MTDQTRRVLDEIHADRTLHDDHEGRPHYPDFDPRDPAGIRDDYEEKADRLQADNDARAKLTTGCCGNSDPHDHLAWDGLLQERTYAALGEAHPVRQRTRLLYLATAAVEWIEDLDRRMAAAAAAYVPPGGYLRSDGVECCAHATPVGPGSCEHCWDLAKWDVLGGEQQ